MSYGKEKNMFVKKVNGGKMEKVNGVMKVMASLSIVMLPLTLIQLLALIFMTQFVDILLKEVKEKLIQIPVLHVIVVLITIMKVNAQIK